MGSMCRSMLPLAGVIPIGDSIFAIGDLIPLCSSSLSSEIERSFCKSGFRYVDDGN